MARKRRTGERKLRTREHILEDLSINFVERQIFLRGFAVSQVATDYGIDLAMLTFTDAGEVENGHVLFQVKAADTLNVLKDQETISVRVEVADLKAWQEEWAPVILVVYDGQKDRAYWLYIQGYLDEKNVSADDLAAEQDRVTIRLPMKNRLNRAAIERFRQLRDLHRRRIEGGPTK